MRFGYLDSIRGLAIVLMVIFHTAFDLDLFGLVKTDLSSPFWFWFAKLGVFLFMFSAGASLSISHAPKIDFKAVKSRSLKLGIASILITIVTYFSNPGEWVYFGAIHCILVGSLLALFFVNKPKLSLSIVLLTIIGMSAGYGFEWAGSFIKRDSIDFIPLYPWFSVILMGMVIEPFTSNKLKSISFPQLLIWLGKNSFVIYLIHQPIIFGITFLLYKIKT